MTTQEVVYGDGERESVDWLLDELHYRWPSEHTVGVDLPADWTTDADPHVQVSLDGTPSAVHPIIARQTIRLTAYSGSKTTSKRLVAVAQSVLLVHSGNEVVSNVEFLTGVQPAKDPTTGAEIASATVRMTVRAEPAELAGS
jgi:hypothetical protein